MKIADLSPFLDMQINKVLIISGYVPVTFMLSNVSLVSDRNNLEIFSPLFPMLKLSYDGGHLGFPIDTKGNGIL
jgi:hypothetical protein